jgi:hypothetical protein
LLFVPCCLAIVPCCFALLVVGPYYLAIIALPSRPVACLFLVPHAPPPCCFATLLIIVMPCCFVLSVGIPSSFSYASGGAWSNTNKLHPTIEIFFFLDFFEFFFFWFVFCLFVLF